MDTKEKNDTLQEINTTIDNSSSDYYSDVFAPGETKEQLRIGQEVMGSTGGIYSTIIQQSISTTTTITVNPGFLPTYIEFSAYNNGNPGGSCHTIYTTSTGAAKGEFISYSFTGSYINTNYTDFTSTSSVLRIDEYNTSNNIRARVENLSTSFDLNFYEVEFTGYITVIIKCY